MNRKLEVLAHSEKMMQRPNVRSLLVYSVLLGITSLILSFAVIYMARPILSFWIIFYTIVLVLVTVVNIWNHLCRSRRVRECVCVLLVVSFTVNFAIALYTFFRDSQDSIKFRNFAFVYFVLLLLGVNAGMYYVLRCQDMEEQVCSLRVLEQAASEDVACEGKRRVANDLHASLM